MIKKNIAINKGTKIADAIIKNPFLILVIERFGIKLGLQEKTAEIICGEYNISLKVFLTIINLYNDIEYNTNTNFNCYETLSIIQYLKNSHKYFIEEVYPEINNDIQLMYEINSNPENLMVEKFFIEYSSEVNQHFNYENNTVFPYIINLFNNSSKKKLKTLKNNYSVNDYKEHHNDIEQKLKDLKNLLIKYLTTMNDDIIRRKILFSLFKLEYDLNVHTQIENNILIPLVEKMENKIKKRQGL